MSMLKAEPTAVVRSLDELFAIAWMLEEEAASRYAELAVDMRAAGSPSVAETFEHLAAEERGHADHVREWSHARTGAVPDPALIRWQPPETLDEEEARNIATSSLASAYRALSMAVRNEERAFALWTYIAAQAEDPEIRAAAERMASEELRHAALLRRERRRAFHMEHRGGGTHPNSPPRISPAGKAARAERALAVLLAELALAPSAPTELRRLASDAAEMAEAAEAEAPESRGMQPLPTIDPGAAQLNLLEEALRLCERTIEAYLDAGERAESEEAMQRLQALASRAISRATTLREIVKTTAPS